MAARPKSVPAPTVERLCRYHRCLKRVRDSGTQRISSAVLAALSGTTPEQVRKDLSYFGSFGRRGVGYDVEELIAALETILACTQRRVAIIGAGNLGLAIARYLSRVGSGFEIAGVYDIDPALVGRVVRGLRIRHVSMLRQDIAEAPIDIGILCVPERSAQSAAEMAIRAGIRALLNFAPVTVRVPENVIVRDADVSADLEWLSFWLSARTPHCGASGNG
ncbi:MAG: redox-sensing transcriptional repressor Rex [Armatimonadetes bacterium]|nr:redox-sensing transcriptional repressor Rex [Armatimonadota bacterium]